jgi:hypothetical protein
MKYASWPIFNLILKLLGIYGLLTTVPYFFHGLFSCNFMGLNFLQMQAFQGFFFSLLWIAGCIFVIFKSYWITTLLYGSDPDGPNGK